MVSMESCCCCLILCYEGISSFSERRHRERACSRGRVAGAARLASILRFFFRSELQSGRDSPETASTISEAMEAYKRWVRQNKDYVHSLESLANGLTRLLPERFSESEIGPEAD